MSSERMLASKAAIVYIERMPQQRIGQIAGFNIPISVGVFGVSALLVVGFSVAFAFLPSYRDVITFVALAVTAAGGVGGAFYVAQSLAMQLEQQREQEAFSLIARWNSPDLFHSRAACYKALDLHNKQKDAGAVTELLKSDAQLALNARHVLNFLEELAIAVRIEHVDEELAARAFAGLVIRSYRAFNPWINEHRTAAQRQKLWSELEALYEKWQNR
jgi:hypothetical protein